MYSSNHLHKIFLLFTLYIVALFSSNTLGLKLMPFVFGTNLSVSVFFFPFVFLVPDIVAHVYDKRLAQKFVLYGFLSIVIFILFSLISISMPWSTESLWVKESYKNIFGVSLRISLASLVAFIIAGYKDVSIFFLSKKYFLKRTFWFHSFISNICSQALDTIIFMCIAFLGVYDIKTIVSISISWWIYKVTMGFLYTPLSYFGIYWLQKK